MASARYGPRGSFDRPGRGWIWQFELQPGF
jgi:hypothetical protein